MDERQTSNVKASWYPSNATAWFYRETYLNVNIDQLTMFITNKLITSL